MATKRNVFTTDVFFEDMFGTHIIQSQYNPHEHSFIEITYVVEGTAKHYTSKHEELLTKSDFYLLRPKDIHTYVDFGFPHTFHRDIICSLELFENICNFIHPQLYKSILEYPDYIKLPFYNENFYINEQLINQYSLIPIEEKELRNSYARLIVLNFLNIYIKNIFNKVYDEHDIYTKLLTAMHKPSVLQGGIDALINEFGYSHGHLCRIVKQNSENTLIELLTLARIEYASQLLKNIDIPISDIAYSVGYDSSSHFIQLFRKYKGITPLQFRMQLMHKK